LLFRPPHENPASDFRSRSTEVRGHALDWASWVYKSKVCEPEASSILLFSCFFDPLAAQTKGLTAAGSVSPGLKGGEVAAVEDSEVEGGEAAAVEEAAAAAAAEEETDPSYLQRSWMLSWMRTTLR